MLRCLIRIENEDPKNMVSLASFGSRPFTAAELTNPALRDHLTNCLFGAMATAQASPPEKLVTCDVDRGMSGALRHYADLIESGRIVTSIEKQDINREETIITLTLSSKKS